jgi:flagellar biosynthesis component FlhA
MRHQVDVVAIEATHVHEVVAEQLAARIKLLEVREAAGERMPTRVDDFGIREHRMDHSDVQEVVGHLVDEQGPAHLALNACALDVLLAEQPQFRGALASEHLRIGDGFL